MNQWTSEPWPENGQMYAKGDLFKRPQEGGVFDVMANRKRASHCVNGCAGLNPEAYREVIEALKQAREIIYGEFSSIEQVHFIDEAIKHTQEI